MNYKILSSLILIFSILSINISSASEIGCGSINGEKRYKCQIKNNCEQYKPKNFSYKTINYFFPEKEVESKSGDKMSDIKINDFLNAIPESYGKNSFKYYLKQNNLIKTAKELYKENQNSIYKCSLINIQKSTLKIIKEKLIKIGKSGDLKSRIDKKLELKLNKIKLIEKQEKCIFPSHQEKKDTTFNPKQQVLRESSYEFCKYNYYLDFLKNYYKDMENVEKSIIKQTNQSTKKSQEIASIYGNILNEIYEEENHSTQVFRIAFETYVDFEDNYPIHVLLEVIKEDFKIIRRKFHEAISPLNQVVYKISNAMSIH